MTPEQHLFFAVMRQSLVDLFIGTPSSSNPQEGDLIRREALAFFTDATGGWARSRQHICTIIDRDHDAVRLSIIAILEGAELPYMGDVRGNGLEKARALWAEQKDREAAAQAERLRRAAPKAVAPPVAHAAPVAPKMARIKESRKAAKPWLCPPLAPEDWAAYDVIEVTV